VTLGKTGKQEIRTVQNFGNEASLNIANLKAKKEMWDYYYYYYCYHTTTTTLQLSCHSVAVVLAQAQE
jgi:hypothetical protein